jgi:septal ring factor EnvC (AmiA/AmiB activator)
LGRILAEDEKLLEQLLADQQRQAGLLADLKAQQAGRQDLQTQLSGQVSRIAVEKAGREDLLAKIRANKSLQIAALAALQDRARDLDRRIEDLRGETTVIGPATEPNSKPFRELKGLLNHPVSGMMVTHFGAYRNETLNVMNFRSGVDIKAEKGAAVRAVCSGKVLFADWFKGYGNMIIIDHGDSYYTVYAHMESMAARKGAGVAAGEVIGAVGEAGLEGFPKLYFEVRHHGKPQDPAQWLKNG